MPEIPWEIAGQQYRQQLQAKDAADQAADIAAEGEATGPAPAISPAEAEYQAGKRSNALADIARRQAQKQAEAQQAANAQFAAEHPIRNVANAFAANALQPFANYGSRVIHNFAAGVEEPTNMVTLPTAENPQPTQMFEQVRQKHQQEIQAEIAQHQQMAQQLLPHDEETSLGGMFAAKAGGMVPIVASAAGGPGAMAATMLSTGYENRAEDIERRRAAGESITPSQVAGYQGLGGGLDVASTFIMPGGAASKELLGDLPFIGRAAGSSGLTAVDMGLLQAGQNATKIASGIGSTEEKAQPFMQRVAEGVPEASVTGGILGPVMEGAHTLTNLPNLREASREAKPAAAPAEPVQAPELRKSIEALNERLNKKVAELKPNESIKREETALPPELANLDLHKFESPEEVGGPGGFGQQLQVKELQDRLAAMKMPEPRTAGDRRAEVQPTPAEAEQRSGEERRMEEALKGATFQTPEEVNPTGMAALKARFGPSTEGETNAPAGPKDYGQPTDLNALQKAAGEKAVAEEYGTPTKSPATPTTPVPSVAPEGETLFQKATRLASEESGGLTPAAAGKAFVEQDVAPAIKKVWNGTKDVFKALDRSENLGFTSGKVAKQEELNLVKTLADAKMAGQQIEAKLAPSIQHAPKFSQNEAAAIGFADKMETDAGRHELMNAYSELSPAIETIAKMRTENKAQADALGLKGFTVDRMSRKFTFKDNPASSGAGSVAGAESWRHGQDYDTYSEAHAAAKEHGGVPAYDDVITSQIAAQYEVKRSLDLRERLRKSEDEGSVAWASDKSRLPEGNVRLDDKISGETRRLAYPSWMMGKYGKMDPFEGNKFLEQSRDRAVAVRPGEQPPDGFSFSDHEERGSYHAAGDVANIWNNAAHYGEGDALTKLPEKLMKASTNFVYDYSPAHAITGYLTHIGKSTYDAVSSLWGANKNSLLKIASDLNIYGPETNRLLKEIQSPGSDPDPRMQEIARRVQEGGAGIKTKSVLDQSHWQDVVDRFKSGNWQGGSVKILQGVAKEIKAGTYDSVLNRIAAISAKREIVNQMAKGVGAEEGQSRAYRQSQALNRGLGRHTDIPNFKDSVISRVGKLLVPAWSFRTGLLRNVVETCRGDPHAVAMVVGNLFSGAVAGTAICRLMGGRWPSSLQDIYNPPDGRQNDAGHDERISMGIWSFLPRLLGADGWEGVKNELSGMVNPMVKGAGEVIANKDFAGNQIRPEEGSTAGNFFRGTRHIMQQGLPLMAKSQMQSSPEAEEPTVGERAMKFAGWGVGHAVTSPAEKTAYDILGSRGETGGRNLEQQEAHANQTKWVRMIRAGNAEQAASEMQQSSSMTGEKAQSIFKRAEASQNLVRLMHDTRLGPADLEKIWGNASDDDKTKIKDALIERLGKANPKNEADATRWESLQKAIGE